MPASTLPVLEFTTDEITDILDAFGGEDGYTAAFSAWLRARLEQHAYSTAKVSADEQVAQAVQEAMASLPAALSDPEQP